MSDYAATNKFTTLNSDELMASMRKVEGLSVVATTNADGTPNAAIFVPMMVDNEHLIMTLAKNRTRENLERDGRATLVYDVADKHATEKRDRHRGARLQLSLVPAQSDEHAQIASKWPQMNEFTLALHIDEIEPLG